MKRCGMPFEILVDYHEGHAGEQEVRQVREHLAQGCSSCKEQLAGLGRLFSAMSAAPLEHAPDAARERARALFRERYEPKRRPSLLARLVFDSRTRPALAGARGEAAVDYQLRFEAGPYEVELWQERQPAGSWYLIGQVSTQGAPVRPASASLLAVGAESAASLEEDEFHMAGVKPGLYSVRLDLPEGELLLPEVPIGI